MATPESVSRKNLELSTRRPDLALILGGQAISVPPPVEQSQPEYVPYDGTHPLIDEAGWMNMNYGQLANVRDRLSDELGLLLQQRHIAEKNRQWGTMSYLEIDFNTLVSKITWVNGMLKDRRH